MRHQQKAIGYGHKKANENSTTWMILAAVGGSGVDACNIYWHHDDNDECRSAGVLNGYYTSRGTISFTKDASVQDGFDYLDEPFDSRLCRTETGGKGKWDAIQIKVRQNETIRKCLP